MTRFFQIFLTVVAVALLAWLLPWFYRFATVRSEARPFVIYSQMIGDFAIINRSAGSQTSPYTDRQGNRYTQTQFDSILPTFYYRQLIADNRFPDTLFGQPVTPKQIKTGNFIFRHSPSDLNVRKAPLYPLLESRSKRVDLEMPGDVFRFTKEGMEFIDMTTNRIETEKSELFTNLFKRKGVLLPIKTIAGNPTNRKEYDEGYFFTDAADRLFHLKQVQGRPFLRQVEVPGGISVEHLFVTEYPARRYFAFLTDTEGSFYALTMPDYKLKKIGVRPFFPKQDELTVFGNPFNWTVIQPKNDTVFYTAVDTEHLEPLATMEIAREKQGSERLQAWLFPFDLSFTSPRDKYFYPRIQNLSLQALLPNIVLVALFLLLFRRRRSDRILITRCFAIGFFGIFAFVPLMLLTSKR